MTMHFISGWRIRAIVALILSLVFAFSSALFAFAAEPLIQLSSDPYRKSGGKASVISCRG
jgi:hypothetical protein